jgi:acyl-CoA thioesterase YciA
MTKLELRERVYPTDLNHHGKAFGGFIMSKLDKAASMAVDEIVYTPAVTAAVSNLTFLRPVNNGDIINVYTTITKIGNTSIHVDASVKVVSYAKHLEMDVTTATFIFVCVDESGQKISVKDVLRPRIPEYIYDLVRQNDTRDLV